MNLEDIAKKAGVSRSTVSRVINNDPNVRKQTREHVRKIIREEDFQINPHARALVTRRTEIIGVVIPTAENIFYNDNNYFTQLLAGFGQTVRERDYDMLLWLGELTGNDERLIQKVSNNRLMDGVIIASMTHDHPLFKRVLNLRSTFVMIDRPLEHADRISYVAVDNVRGGENATNHLINLGRRRIAHITGHMNISDAQDRLQGYKNALTRAGLPIDPDLIVEGLFERKAGYDAALRLLPFKPDAIFAASDMIAVGVLQAAHQVGVRIPDDLALIGFDDVDVASQAIPMLTTVRQPVQEKGAAAAELLINLIENRVEGPQHVLLETTLVIRQSSGAQQSQTALVS
jgi:LacI family transcriptional regulator